MAFEHPIVVAGEPATLVDRIESDVVIPGNCHSDLWVHPELVSVPGSPIVIELRAVSTDRHGRDQHSEWHYFKGDEDCRFLLPIDSPQASAWRRIRLRQEDFARPRKASLQLPETLGHTWSSACLELEGNRILQSFTTMKPGRPGSGVKASYAVQSLLARFESGRMIPIHLSNAWTNETGRGLYEPHLAEYRGRFFMTARAEDGRGYVMVSHDGGLSWNQPVPWCWDDGRVVDMDQTMTKLLSHSNGLVLVYTRVRDDNIDTFRHRTPLHCADLDPDNLTLKRATERIIVPNRSVKGGRSSLSLGNFWVWPINEEKSYVVVAEWPRGGDPVNGDIWLAKLYWRHANLRFSLDGYRQDLD